MPEYTYACGECEVEFEITHSIKLPALKTCPKCGQSSLERLISSGIFGFVRGDVTTVGQLAEKNSKSMGKCRLQEKQHILKNKNRPNYTGPIPEGYVVNNETPKDPWYKDKNIKFKEIVNMSPEKKQKFIMTGER